MSGQTPLSIGQAVGRWILHTLVFIIAGGVAAGVSSLVYESLTSAQNDVVVYGVVFAASGWIAYRLSRRAVDGG